MKVYISADIEGVTGLVSWSQCGRPNSDYYDYRWARERMTADVNAAIRGARRAGATEIWVKDSHGNSKNLLIDQLDDVVLVSGHGSATHGMMQGIDSSFDVAFLVGYHAMAGTHGGIMEHTISGRVHRMTINDLAVGEIAMSAGVAGAFGVPIGMLSSDRAGCEEGVSLIPDLSTACVKVGTGRYMGECLPPSVTQNLIEDAAMRAVRQRNALTPWKPSNQPVCFAIEFNRSEEADMASKLVGSVRRDAYTVAYTHPEYLIAHQAAWNMIDLASLGPTAHD